MIFALDLEGCLAPEIWPALGAQFHVPEFSDPLAAKLGGVNLFANQFEVDEAGIEDAKRRLEAE
jgi:hypothetical protein